MKTRADWSAYKKKVQPRGDPTAGPIKRGLGLSIHTWGGRGHPSECDVTINPDGSVETKLGSQDLGSGTRTVIDIVVAETLGLPLGAVKVQIGRNDYPPSGASGGSTTVGGVSASSRIAATAALNALFEFAAAKLGVAAENLEAGGGEIWQADKPENKISWKDACALLGPSPITTRGVSNPGVSEKIHLIAYGVGGPLMADGSVDVAPGALTIHQIVPVQGCGLVVDLKTPESH